MSSQLAIGAVSAVLRNLLDDGLVKAAPAIGAITVTAVAPDSIKLDDPNFGPQLNLFLYRVSPNQGWQNAVLPAYDSNGTRASNPPLALNLHLLLTAYGKSDFQAEILLGYAMSLLHEHPVLDRASIRTALDPSPLGPSILPPAFQALSASDLADQLESVTLTLEPMDTEEMSRLWSAIQAHYRPTAAYVVSVVLIEAKKPAKDALPVLTVGAFDPVLGREIGVQVHPDLLPPLPTLVRAEPPLSQPAVRLGETLHLEGFHLNGSSVEVHFDHPLLATPNIRTIGTNTGATGIDVSLPSGATADQKWPAGVWTVTVDLVQPGEAVVRSTNAVAVVLAPDPVVAPAPTITRDGTGRVTATVTTHPLVRPSQSARLALGTDTALAEPHPTTTGQLTFKFGVIPDGPQWLRLTVDGAESLLVSHTTVPPSYDATQRVTVPA
jgi:hypothetical protein